MPSLNMSAGVRGELLAQLGSDVKKVPCNNITIKSGRLRSIDKGKVEEMRKSIEDHGLVQPIGVKCTTNAQGYELVFGAHRLMAWRELFNESLSADNGKGMARWHEISAVVYPDEMSDGMQQLIEINENMDRADLTTDQRKSFAGKRAELRKVLGLDEKGGAGKRGGAKGASGTPKGMAWPEMLAATGIAKTTLRHWWESYAKEVGIPPDAPSKQDKKHCDNFLIWLKDAGDRQEAQEQSNSRQATIEAICTYLDGQVLVTSLDTVQEALNEWQKRH